MPSSTMNQGWSMTAFTYTCTRCSVLEVSGTLRAPVTADLRERVAALLERGERRIILDLKSLTDIDAAGVGELVHAFNLTTAAGGALHVARATARTRRLLLAAGLSGLLVESTR